MIKFPDFSLNTLKFPDYSWFSRFSRWVATLHIVVVGVCDDEYIRGTFLNTGPHQLYIYSSLEQSVYVLALSRQLSQFQTTAENLSLTAVVNTAKPLPFSHLAFLHYISDLSLCKYCTNRFLLTNTETDWSFRASPIHDKWCTDVSRWLYICRCCCCKLIAYRIGKSDMRPFTVSQWCDAARCQGGLELRKTNLLSETDDLSDYLRHRSS